MGARLPALRTRHLSLLANQSDEFCRGGGTPCLLFRVDLLAIQQNFQRTWGAGPQPDRNTQFSFNIVFEAHGLSFDVSSEKAAFDLDVHSNYAHESGLLSRLSNLSELHNKHSHHHQVVPHPIQKPRPPAYPIDRKTSTLIQFNRPAITRENF